MNQTIKITLQKAMAVLNENDIEDARLDAEILLAHVLQVNRIFIYTNFDFELNDEQSAEYEKLIKRRAAHEPTAYIIGHREFMQLDFVVNCSVLIPRPDTEILVEAAVNRLKPMKGNLHIADIGTGSGAICISILNLLENVFADAVDISVNAVETAKINAKHLNVFNRINFFVGDLLEPIKSNKYNAIVSNPPYIPNDVIDTLDKDVAEYEPRQALDGGRDGLNFYRRLVKEAPALIVGGGFLVFEIGINQAADITKLIENSGYFKKIEILKDLSNIERVIIAWIK